MMQPDMKAIEQLAAFDFGEGRKLASDFVNIGEPHIAYRDYDHMFPQPPPQPQPQPTVASEPEQPIAFRVNYGALGI